MQFHAHRPSRRKTLVAALGAVVGMALLLALSIGGAAVVLPSGWTSQNSHAPGADLNGISMVQAADGTYHGAAVGGDSMVWSTDGQVWHPGHHDAPTAPAGGYTSSELALNRVHMVDKDFGFAVGEQPDFCCYFSQGYYYSRPMGFASVLITQDGGKSWHTVDSGDNSHLEGVYFLNQFEGWVVGDEGTIRHNTNGGAGDFIQQDTSAASCDSSAAPASRNERLAARNEKTKTSPKKVLPKPSPGADPREVKAGNCGIVGISVHLASNGLLEGWAVGDTGVILHNTDAGNDSSSWTAVVPGGTNTVKDFEGLTCVDANNCVAVGDQGRIVRIVNGVVQPDVFADSTLVRGNAEMELYGVAMAKAADGSWHGFAVGGSGKNSGYAPTSVDPLQGVIISTTDGFNTVTVNYTDFRPFKDVSMPNACTAWASGKHEGFNSATGYTVPGNSSFGSGNNGAIIQFTDPNAKCPVGNQAPANVGLPTTGGLNNVSQALKAPGVNPINGLLGAIVAILLAVVAWGGLRLRWTS